METDKRYLVVLNIFKSDDWLKPGLTTPSLMDGKYYASEGQSLVVFNESVCPGIASVNEHAPNFKSVIPTEVNAGILLNSAEVEMLIDRLVPKIENCYKCSECEGDGFLECNLGHEHDCEACEGQGEIKCMPITLVPNPNAFIIIHGVCFTVKFFKKMLSALKLFELQEVVWVKKEETKANVFISADFTFLIMPVMPIAMCDEYNKYESTVIL